MSSFYTTAIWGYEILHLKVGEFATKVVLWNFTLCVNIYTQCKAVFLYSNWHFLHLVDFVYTTSSCNSRDKYQDCTSEAPSITTWHNLQPFFGLLPFFWFVAFFSFVAFFWVCCLLLVCCLFQFNETCVSSGIAHHKHHQSQLDTMCNQFLVCCPCLS